MLPKPAYLPPCEGWRSSGRLALAAPRPAKYLSSTLALAPGREGEDVRTPRGVWEREVVEEEGKEVVLAFVEGGGLVPGT